MAVAPDHLKSELQTELTESELPRGVLETRRQSQMPDGDVVVASAEIETDLISNENVSQVA
jgi:hypothetical protein